MRCRLLRPEPGENLKAVLLGPLTELRLHWVANRTYPCTECEQCPYCPGKPDKVCYRWYGAAAEFRVENRDPTNEESAIWSLRHKAWLESDGGKLSPAPAPPRSLRIYATTAMALAEITDAQVGVLGDRERRGLMVGWSKGQYKQSPIKVTIIGLWQGALIEEFDWLGPAERILNNGLPIRLAKEDDPNILKLPARKQA